MSKSEMLIKPSRKKLHQFNKKKINKILSNIFWNLKSCDKSLMMYFKKCSKAIEEAMQWNYGA